MARFARQNESFCPTKWPVLKRKMSRFESLFFVKKLQLACFQCFRKPSYFARTRPSDFNFETMALTEAKNEIFVSFFQILGRDASALRNASTSGQDGKTTVLQPAAFLVRFRGPVLLCGLSSGPNRRSLFVPFCIKSVKNGMCCGSG